VAGGIAGGIAGGNAGGRSALPSSFCHSEQMDLPPGAWKSNGEFIKAVGF